MKENKLKKMDLMYDGTGGTFWSRDFSLENIPCKIKQCPSNQNNICMMPSCIKIGENGVCETGQKYIKKENNGN